MGRIRDILSEIRNWPRRRTFREGKVISRFVACDIRRDILVVSAARIDTGIITARVRTTNVLYHRKGVRLAPEFGPATELPIDKLWGWTGKSWGGSPDGASIVDHDSLSEEHEATEKSTTEDDDAPVVG